jgi:hypothetical protein
MDVVNTFPHIRILKLSRTIADIEASGDMKQLSLFLLGNFFY